MKADLEIDTAAAIEAPRLGEPYLLTPGPLTTAYSVKEQMLRDWGSWDGDFRAMTARLRAELLALVGQVPKTSTVCRFRAAALLWSRPCWARCCRVTARRWC